MLATGPGIALASDTVPISLEIDNATGQAMRCTMVYAHFVSDSTPAFSQSHSLQFDRHMGSGSLSESASGKSMMLENILCGIDAAWQDSVTEILLLPLRSGAARAFTARCALNKQLDCSLSLRP